MTTKTSQPVTSEELSAYFDGELEAERVDAVVRALEEDPSLRAQHSGLGLLRESVRTSAEAHAQSVPAARFEQIWDQIDRAIERDARLQADANRNASIWGRLWAALRPVRMPVMVAAATAAVVAVVVAPGSNNPEGAPSVAEAPALETTPVVAPELPPRAAPDELALGELAAPSQPDPKLRPMTVPETSEAEIHGIEFGGKHGRISNTGTVTVLYVEEDETPTNSERSL